MAPSSDTSVLFFFNLFHVALVSQPGIRPAVTALEGQNLNHWTIREVLWYQFWPGAGPKKSESESHSVVSDSLRPHGLYSPWNSPGQNTGVGSLSLLQGIFPTQGWNPGLAHCRRILYQLSHNGSPKWGSSDCRIWDIDRVVLQGQKGELLGSLLAPLKLH